MVNRIIGMVFWLGVAALLATFAIGRWYPAGDKYVTYLLYGGLVCLLVYVLGQWREIVRMFAGRQARYGALTGVSVLVVLGILIAINYIGARQNKRWDLTTNQQFSLSDQSRNVLKTLDAPLQITVFDKTDNFARSRERLKEYEYVSKNVSIEYVDPDKKPALASQNQIQQYGTLLFNYKGRSERVTTDTEQDITSGIIKVVQGQTKKIYFTKGHGEKDTASAERDGYKAIADGLGHDNYSVDSVVLAQVGAVPDDAAVVVVAGPKADFLPGEITALKKYLDDKAGKLLLEIDPPEKPDSPPLANLIALAHDWGMDLGNDIVVDASGMGQLVGTGPEVPLAASYPSHAITQRLKLITGFPLARSVTAVAGGVNGHTAQGFVQTSERSWAESDIKSVLTTGKVQMNTASGDKPGPIMIAAAVSASASSPTPAAPKPGEADAPKPETRVVVFGDSDFASTAALGLPGNRDLFMNTIGWLSQQENLISIRPKEAGDSRVTLTAVQSNEVTLMSLLIIPGLVFGAGVYSWWRRR